MAERNPKIYEMVLEELRKNPGVGSKDLYQLAQSSEKGELTDTLQQFHARYFLPAKRELRPAGAPRRQRRAKPARTGARRGAAASANGGAAAPRARARAAETASPEARDRVRSLLLQFAQELADAQDTSSVVKVLGKVDSYVDRITASTS